MRILFLTLFLTTSAFAQSSDLCSIPPCPCFQGDPCSYEFPARDVICLPNFYIGSEANGLPICSSSPNASVAVGQAVKKTRILEVQVEQHYKASENFKVRFLKAKKACGKKCKKY